MRRPTLLPEEQLALVVTALYEAADAQGWDTLPLADRSNAYGNWVEDPRVGGILTQYMSPEAARSWIKDGPMKEYRRAARGTGRYARFGRQGGTGPADIVASILGAEAELLEHTVGDKPSHCLARMPTGEVTYLAWDEAGNLKNIVWAALSASIEHGCSAHAIVMEGPGRSTTKADAQIHAAIAARCGIGIHHMREQIGQRQPGRSG
jgi:hypothetical protein